MNIKINNFINKTDFTPYLTDFGYYKPTFYDTEDIEITNYFNYDIYERCYFSPERI